MINKFKQWTFDSGLNIVTGSCSNELLSQMIYALYQNDLSNFITVPIGDCSPGNIGYDFPELGYYEKLGMSINICKLSKIWNIPKGFIETLFKWKTLLINIDNIEPAIITNLISYIKNNKYQGILFTCKQDNSYDCFNKVIQFRKKIIIRKK
jgi:hypothetical protein